MRNKSFDPAKNIDRLEMTEVMGASIGSLSLGAAGVVAFTELVQEQPEQYYIAGALAGLAVTAFGFATNAGVKIPVLKSMMKADVQPGTQSQQVRQD